MTSFRGAAAGGASSWMKLLTETSDAALSKKMHHVAPSLTQHLNPHQKGVEEKKKAREDARKKRRGQASRSSSTASRTAGGGAGGDAFDDIASVTADSEDVTASERTWEEGDDVESSGEHSPPPEVTTLSVVRGSAAASSAGVGPTTVLRSDSASSMPSEILSPKNDNTSEQANKRAKRQSSVSDWPELVRRSSSSQLLKKRASSRNLVATAAENDVSSGANSNGSGGGGDHHPVVLQDPAEVDKHISPRPASVLSPRSKISYEKSGIEIQEEYFELSAKVTAARERYEQLANQAEQMREELEEKQLEVEDSKEEVRRYKEQLAEESLTPEERARREIKRKRELTDELKALELRSEELGTYKSRLETELCILRDCVGCGEGQTFSLELKTRLVEHHERLLEFRKHTKESIRQLQEDVKVANTLMIREHLPDMRAATETQHEQMVMELAALDREEDDLMQMLKDGKETVAEKLRQYFLLARCAYLQRLSDHYARQNELIRKYAVLRTQFDIAQNVILPFVDEELAPYGKVKPPLPKSGRELRHQIGRKRAQIQVWSRIAERIHGYLEDERERWMELSSLAKVSSLESFQDLTRRLQKIRNAIDRPDLKPVFALAGLEIIQRQVLDDKARELKELRSHVDTMRQARGQSEPSMLELLELMDVAGIMSSALTDDESQRVGRA